MRQMPIYKAEADLAAKILSTSSLAYTSEVEVVSASEMSKSVLEKIAAQQSIATDANGQVDLFYLKSILATVGWNKNDDVFDRKEVWIARSTPEDKPFNLEHNPRQVRGHITGSYVIDMDGKLVADDTKLDDVPGQYHVVTNAVLYKFIKCGDDELEKETAKIIEEIKNPRKDSEKWYVSMEALFDDFDYAVVDKNGKNHVIARNEDSAFLTKHLRIYGGDGTYEGNKIGRLLKNMFFSGKGLVRRPANQHSIIFDTVASFNQATASSVQEISKVISDVGYSSSDVKHIDEESNRMADTNNTQLELAQAEVKRLEATIASLTTKANDAEKRLTEMNEQAVKAKLDAADKAVKERDEKITSLTTQVQAEQKARQDAEAKLAESEKGVNDLKTQLTKINQEKTKAARVAVLVTELGKAQADAEKFYDEHVADLNMNDERFVKFVASIKPVTPPATKPADSTTVINNAQPTNDGKAPALGTDGVQKNIEETRANLGSFLSKSFLHGKRTQAAN